MRFMAFVNNFVYLFAVIFIFFNCCHVYKNYIDFVANIMPVRISCVLNKPRDLLASDCEKLIIFTHHNVWYIII